jgi:hypothetical protein
MSRKNKKPTVARPEAALIDPAVEEAPASPVPPAPAVSVVEPCGPACCEIGCERPATQTLVDGPGPEQHTEACDEHAEGLTRDTHVETLRIDAPAATDAAPDGSVPVAAEAPVDAAAQAEVPAAAVADAGPDAGAPPAPKRRVCIVQLARHGDVVNTLPIARELASQGYAVDFVVHRAFAPILEAVSYVNPIVVDGVDNEPEPHAQAALDSGNYSLVLSTQVNGNPRTPAIACESFVVQSWARAGREWVDRFHELPLVFDRRDAAGESDAVEEHVPAADGRPLLAYCLEGYSSPFGDRAAFEEWLVNKHRGRYRLLNLADAKRLPKVHHLIGLIEAADVLVTVDSLPLHLAYVTGTPTIALSRGIPHYNSEPRSHWVGRFMYPDANGPAARQAIYDLLRRSPVELQELRGTLCRPPRATLRNRIVQAVDWYVSPKASDERRRNLAARRTWERLRDGDEHFQGKADWEVAFHELQPGQRSSRDLGDDRRLPYIRDIIDHAAARAADDDVLAFTNADTLVLPDAPGAIREKLTDGDCCYSRRIDVSSGEHPYTREQLGRYPRHVGADLFAFRAGWWRSHLDEFPDLLLACEGWDWVARRIMERHNPAAEIDPPVVYHERHSPVWAYSKNIHANAGQRWNRAQCEAWARANGFAHAIFTDGTPFLFKSDDALRPPA